MNTFRFIAVWLAAVALGLAANLADQHFAHSQLDWGVAVGLAILPPLFGVALSLPARTSRDQVILCHYDGEHQLRPVDWHCGQPFSAPYTSESTCHLLPAGKVIGKPYLVGWLPASRRMEAYFCEAGKEAGDT